MSAQEIAFYSPSAALISLCQSQVQLLQKCFGLDRCEVYVTQGSHHSETFSPPGRETFIPLAIYPQTEQAFVSMGGVISLPQDGSVLEWLGSSPLLLQPEGTSGTSHGGNDPITPYSQRRDELVAIEQPLVLPLVYQEEVMGILVTGRRTPTWQSLELQQLEVAAQTLAIACQLDRGQNWYAVQLQQQQLRQKLDHDRFDDLLHQLRNPLTALKTFSKLLLKRLGKEEKTQTIVEGIVREGEHLQELLQNFETQIGNNVESVIPEVWEAEAWGENLAESQAPLLLPSQTLGLTSLEIKPILAQVLLAETAIATERQINLQSDLRDLPPIQGNAHGLREVFHNLIGNALKYTPSQGTVWVRSGLIHPQQPQRLQGIEIADTGYGIPLQDQQHIFERHYRGVQAEGDIAGTGLGLAIVQELVAMMEGHLELISPNYLSQDERYPGTTFRLWLKLSV